MGLGVTIVNGFKANRNGKINYIPVFSQLKAKPSVGISVMCFSKSPELKFAICLGAFSDNWCFCYSL